MSRAWAIGTSLVLLEVETGVAHDSVYVVPHQVEESSRILVAERQSRSWGHLRRVPSAWVDGSGVGSKPGGKIESVRPKNGE